MSETYRVVVGVDLEEAGDVALRTALTHAAGARAVELHRLTERPLPSVPSTGTSVRTPVEIHAVHVIAPRAENLAVLSRYLETGLAALRARVQSVSEGMRTEVPVRLHVRLGNVAQTLEQVAIDYDADLLVVGTHGRTGAARLVLGSVAAELTKAARMPVLVAREKDFAGLARTPSLDPALPGAELHRDQHVTDLIHVGRRNSHIAGMV